MRYSRPVRLIFGILILIAFGWYMAKWFSGAVMSNEVGQAQPSEMTMVETPEELGTHYHLVFE